MTQTKYIAIGFDGTVVKNRFPDVGDAIPHAQDTILELQKHGVKIILHTLREGEELDKSIEWFTLRGIRLFGVNYNSAQKQRGSQSEKLWAHLYIDIANAGCPCIIEDGEKSFADWYALEQILISTKLLPGNPVVE